MGYAIEMKNVTKKFGQLVANDNISIQIKNGEIHALLGENGAGKSTLMSILFGLYQPDSGDILIDGKVKKISNPNVATALNIGMVHQHFKLVENFTVLQNIILGIEPNKFGFLNLASARDKINKISNHYQLNVDLDAKIEDISVGMQQRVEILKMLYRDAKYIILDEPSAVLTPQEINELIKIIRQLSSEGKAIILITHKLKEIKEVADRCTVIRRGKVIGTVDVASTSVSDMATMMVGRPVVFEIDKQDQHLGDITLSIKDLHVKNARGLDAVKGISFDVRAGEILGVAGVDGSGQSELIEALTGLCKVDSGTISYLGKEITHTSIRSRIDNKIAHIPEDRHKYGLVLDYTLEQNTILLDYYQPQFSSNGILKFGAIKSFAEKIISDFDVRSSAGLHTIARSMSGGNQQKAIVGREIERDPNLLIAAQPTRGLDVGAIQYIHERLLEQRDAGKAVLLISLELDEVLKMSDRVIVMHDGQIMGDLITANTDENELGLLMAGIRGGKND